MQNDIRITMFAGHEVRWIYDEGRWWAVLKDVCDALGISTWHAKERIYAGNRCYMDVEYKKRRTEKYGRNLIPRSTEEQNVISHRTMICVNSKGVLECVSKSRSLKAEQFMMWVADVLDELRADAHIAEYNALSMLEPEVRNTIDICRHHRGTEHAPLNNWANADIVDTFEDEYTGLLVYKLWLASGRYYNVATIDYDQWLSGDWTEEDQERADRASEEYEPYYDPNEGHWEREED